MNTLARSSAWICRKYPILLLSLLHGLSIVPILVATEASSGLPWRLRFDDDKLYRPIGVSADGLRAVMDEALRIIIGSAVDDTKMDTKSSFVPRSEFIGFRWWFPA